MDAQVDIWIRRAEEAWLDTLLAHAERLFIHSRLPSHDHSHHLRVWNLSKVLLREISGFNSRLDHSLVEGVLIAALFHDLGMAASTREDHGRLSRELCETWFREQGLIWPVRREEILRAIEDHDRKEEEIYHPIEAHRPPDILSIISVADDLEALGTIGIYRYAEIYLRRGIPLDELGDRILDNAGKRFGKLEKACRPCPALLVRLRHEYDELCEFYGKYKLQVKESFAPDAEKSGPLGVINYIRKKGVYAPSPSKGGEERDEFFIRLKNELERARL